MPKENAPTQPAAKFDKYALYREAVQDTEGTAEFLRNAYRQHYGREPLRLREDFCGSFALCADWVQASEKHTAVAIDNDARPLRYGERTYRAALARSEQHRLKVRCQDVLKGSALPKADVAVALNFSYCVFQERSLLLRYLQRTRRAFGPRGVLMLDCLPGIEVAGSVETEFHFPTFTYFWEQRSFDPITRRGRFSIHLQRPGEERRKHVFRYDWRLWSPPELRDLLQEAGYASVEAYAAGGDRPDSCGSLSLCFAAFA